MKYLSDSEKNKRSIETARDVDGKIHTDTPLKTDMSPEN